MKTNDCTNDYENVEILFGLTPSQVYYAASTFFDSPRICSTALIEMLEAIQQAQDKDEDNSIVIEFTKSIRVVVDVERMVYNLCRFNGDFGISDEPLCLEEMDEDKKESINQLHDHFINIVRQVEEIGYINFFINTTSSIFFVKTKIAYEDMMLALAVVQILYVAYIKSKCRFQSEKCRMIVNG